MKKEKSQNVDKSLHTKLGEISNCCLVFVSSGLSISLSHIVFFQWLLDRQDNFFLKHIFNHFMKSLFNSLPILQNQELAGL